MSSESEPKSSELDWLAFRYVAGELGADEARSFDDRLASDLAAQEAMSRAAALSIAIAAARPSVEPRRTASVESRQSRFMHAVTWLSIGVAATVAVWIGSAILSNPEVAQHRAESNLVQTAQPAPASAVAWLELRKLDDSAARIERELKKEESDEPMEFQRDPAPVVPAWVVDLAVESQSKAKP